jgi:hypothetical protein
MAECGFLFAVRAEFLNIIYTSLGFKKLNDTINHPSSENDTKTLTTPVQSVAHKLNNFCLILRQTYVCSL